MLRRKSTLSRSLLPRKKIFLKQQVLEHPDLIYIPGTNPDDFSTWLQNLRGNKPLFLDIGMGTGDFLVSTATLEPDAFFLGIEVKKDRISKALRKTAERKLVNVAFLLSSAEHLKRIGVPKADGIYLLFPDPWPKKRHSKRRMISRAHLKRYTELLDSEARLVFKTDEPSLFEEGLLHLRALNWTVHEMNRTHNTPPHLQTAYEKRFLEKRRKVHYCSASPPLIHS